MTVVVGVDGSDHSRRALRWGVSYARLVGQHVTAVAVWNTPPQFGIAPVAPLTEFDTAAQAWIDDALAAVPHPQQEAVRRRIEHGDPATTLLDLAGNADVLVLGNKGRGALTGALTGSVALRCAHHATCPVVLIP